ncbi:MAG TPA: hypothetical protein VKG87_09125 [Terriglobales bacterium]|nr:hypothetical protein [Terriglobales bacterium]
MRKPSILVSRCAVVVLTMLVILPGCKINVKKDAAEQDKRVDISTLIGGIHVSNGLDARDLGVAVYPGARPRQEKDNDQKGANVNISSPYFGIKVAAQEYESDDSMDKVISFYTDQLKRYGAVVKCHGKWKGKDANAQVGHDSGKHSHEVTCDKDSSGDSIELKVGTEENQHLVAIEPQGKGCKFALVRVEVRGEEDTI